MSPAASSIPDLFFTDHNKAIPFDNGAGPKTYTPVGGFDTSARELAAGLREQNLDFRGVITSAAITHADLDAGKYDNADLTEYLVDWLDPHAGAIRTRSYKIGSTQFTSEIWTAQLNGLANRLNARSGRQADRPCDAEVFDSSTANRCKILETAQSPTTGSSGSFPPNTLFRFAGIRVDDGTQDVTEPRRIFQAETSDLASTQDDWFNYGEVRWTTGANADAGVISEVKDFTNTTRLIELYEPTPFAIDDTDEFTILAGCDKLFGTCRFKFGNGINYRGQPYMPSSLRVLRVPSGTSRLTGALS